jgi:hypothetical protein
MAVSALIEKRKPTRREIESYVNKQEMFKIETNNLEHN